MKKMWIVLAAILMVALIITCPLFIDVFIFGNSIPSNITNGEWASFLGSYLGAIIGAIVSLLGIAATIVFTNNQNRKDRELQIRPYFVIRYQPTDQPQENKLSMGYLAYEYESKHESEDTTPHINGMILLQNVGIGAAINCCFSDLKISQERIHKPVLFTTGKTPLVRSLKPGEEASFTIHIELNCEKLSEADFNGLIDESLPIKDIKPEAMNRYKNFNIEMSFDYCDILQNKYRQMLRFESNYYTMYQKEEDKGEYICELRMVKVTDPVKI